MDSQPFWFSQENIRKAVSYFRLVSYYKIVSYYLGFGIILISCPLLHNPVSSNCRVVEYLYT